jgi:hypothetical protein
MSKSALRRLWDRLPSIPKTTLPSPHRFVLLCIADEAAQGPAVIAARTGLTAGTVAACLADLEKAGWARGERRSEPRGKGAVHATTVWSLATPGGAVVRGRSGRRGASKATPPDREGGRAPRVGGGGVRGGVDVVGDGAVSEIRRKAKAPDLFDTSGAAEDPVRAAVARGVLKPTDTLGWALWRMMVASPFLRELEVADTTRPPGSLARQAGWLARRLEPRRLGVDAGREFLTELVTTLAAERAAAGSQAPPPSMVTVGERFLAMAEERGLRVPVSVQKPKGAA